MKFINKPSLARIRVRWPFEDQIITQKKKTEIWSQDHRRISIKIYCSHWQRLNACEGKFSVREVYFYQHFSNVVFVPNLNLDADVQEYWQHLEAISYGSRLENAPQLTFARPYHENVNRNACMSGQLQEQPRRNKKTYCYTENYAQFWGISLICTLYLHL